MRNVRKSVAVVLVLAAALALLSCAVKEDMKNENYFMTARLLDLGERLEVDVIESDSGMIGTFWVITPAEVRYKDGRGRQIGRDALRVGDLIRIRFGGQVMMSYPPQIVASEIVLLEK